MTSGSSPPVRPADHLANERTLLAYIRTALSLMAFGFVIARFALFLRYMGVMSHVTPPTGSTSEVLGLAFAIFGLALAIVGVVRYGMAARAIESGVYQSHSTAGVVLGVVTTLLGVLVVASLLRLL
jgi:putative membrane protein